MFETKTIEVSLPKSLLVAAISAYTKPLERKKWETLAKSTVMVLAKTSTKRVA